MNENSTILIVDDDPAGRESLKGLLLSQGYHLLEAENGQQAIQLAQANIPDLVLLDVMMPGMDGFEVCRRLRKDPLMGEIPILMVTALDDRDSRIEGIEAGADDFISKPYDRMELRARVRTVTRLNRYRRLLLERARFVWVVENDHDGYLILDKNGGINFANTTARRLFQLPPEDQGEIKEMFISKIKDYFLCVPPARWEQWPDNNSTEPMFLIRPQDENSQATWYEVHTLDLPWVTQNQRLVRVRDVSKSVAFTLEAWSFQSAACHKLNTPLSNILLSLGLVQLLVKENNLTDLADCVEAIETGARRLEGEIKDILQYIYAPKVSQSGGPFSLADFENLVKQTCQELGIQKVRLAPIDAGLLGCKVKFSWRAMQIVLWEVLENSRKFHPRMDPKIDISLSSHNPDHVMVRIGDNGVSLPPQDLIRILTPYYQSEKVFTGEIEGMGLGLATVASLIWQVGGKVDVYNRSETPGLIVEFQLPVA